ncbi:hypothetical protein L6164_001153 [Bauhinia variegata]|uniref:Uncharacterized protein n=1 Tax=Bauhinia variegata TaxID=167791 RepID=A0ACB9Q8S1_BAUVA|nr:hypothetical protein L6164_001153 [Bauhinia variegata]
MHVSGVELESNKIEAMVNWPVPVTLKQLQAFLGLTGFYKKFEVKNPTHAPYGTLQPLPIPQVAGHYVHKLAKRFYGPYRIIRCIGDVAYELELLPSFQIHPVFHASFLKHIQVQASIGAKGRKMASFDKLGRRGATFQNYSLSILPLGAVAPRTQIRAI